EDATTAPWAAQFGATLALDRSSPASGAAALRVSGRTLNGSGPNQQLGGKIQAGVTYEVSARVRYATGPAQVRFNLVGDWGAGVKTLAWADTTPGEWTTVSGTYTVPAGTDVSAFKLAVETPWANPQPPSSSVEYLLDDVSVVGRAPDVETPTLEAVSYNGSGLGRAWQWNHGPDSRYWSLTERGGCLRLPNGHGVTGEAEYTKAPGRDLTYLEEARNTL